MSNVISANFYTTESPSVTLTGTGTNRLILVIPMSTSGTLRTVDSITLNAVAGTVHGQIGFDGGNAINSAVCYFLDSQHPGAGSFTLASTRSGADNDICYMVVEYDDFNQSTPFDALVTATISNQTEPYDSSVNVTGKAGKQAIVIGVVAEGTVTTAAGSITSNDALTRVGSDNFFSNVRGSIFGIPSIADADETYSLKFNWLNLGTTVMDSLVTSVLAFNGVDITAPVLSSPTGTETGSATADGSVSTDEGNGTLYYYASTNSTETAATIKANGDSQAVSVSGVQNVSFSGLTESTAYYAHYVQDDASSNESTVASSTQFTTLAATLTADSITGGTIRAGDTVTIQLSNATNASGKTLAIPQGSITPSVQDISSISFVAPDLKTFGDKTGDYSTNITITVADGAESDTIDFQIAPDVGDEVGAITALEGIYAEPEFSGVAVTDLYYTATISGADFTVGAVPVLSTEQTFNLWIQDQTDGVWGDPFVVTIPASGTADAIILRPVLRDVLRPVLRDVFNEG